MTVVTSFDDICARASGPNRRLAARMLDAANFLMLRIVRNRPCVTSRNRTQSEIIWRRTPLDRSAPRSQQNMQLADPRTVCRLCSGRLAGVWPDSSRKHQRSHAQTAPEIHAGTASPNAIQVQPRLGTTSIAAADLVR